MPVRFCQNTQTNSKKIYYGTGEALQEYLRAHPEAVEELKIAKLFPGGFVATVQAGKKAPWAAAPIKFPHA